MHYERNDLPIVVDFDGALRKVKNNSSVINKYELVIVLCYIQIAWKVEIDMLDYHHYLPIFFEGLREKEDPQKFLADRGTDELIMYGKDKILPVLPQLIIPIKSALQTKDKETVVKTLKKIQALVQASDAIAESLVPYYRQILPVMNLLKHRNKNIGDKIDYSQKNGDNVGELIQETLE